MSRVFRIIIGLGLVGYGATSLFANFYNLKPITITKDIHCVIGDFHPPMKSNKGFVSNLCYVDIGDSLVALDAGPTYSFAKEFYAIMHKMYPNKKVSYVILTNYHDEKIQGASFFKELGAKIVGYKTINDEIKTHKEKYTRIKKIVSPAAYKNTKVINADTLVDGGYKIKGSKKTLEILKLSKVSEERGDIAVYSKDDSFVFAGNLVFNGRLLNYRKSSNVDGWIEALQNLAKLKEKYVLGGHGKEYDKNSYKPTLEYLKIMRKDTKKAVDDDIDVVDLIKHVHTQKFNYMNHFEKNNE